MTSTDKKKRKNSSEKVFITFDIDSIWHSYRYELFFSERTVCQEGLATNCGLHV